MSIGGRDVHFVDELSAETFDGAAGGVVVRVARDEDIIIDRADEARDGLTGEPGVAVAAMRFMDREADVTGAIADVPGVTEAEIDMPHIRAVGEQDAKMIGGDQVFLSIARHDLDKSQSYRAANQSGGCWWQSRRCC